MYVRYQSVKWSPKSRQDLDAVINQKCRSGWNLYGIYPESGNGNRYRVLFSIASPECELLAEAMREREPAAKKAEREAALTLLQDLRETLRSCPGFEVEGDAGASPYQLRVISMSTDTSVTLEVPDKSGSIYIGSDPFPFRFNSFVGVLEPADAAERKNGHTALVMLVKEILKRTKPPSRTR
jgi:hypothetical protein